MHSNCIIDPLPLHKQDISSCQIGRITSSTERRSHTNVYLAARCHRTDLTACTIQAGITGGKAVTGSTTIDTVASAFSSRRADTCSTRATRAECAAGLASTGARGAGAVNAGFAGRALTWMLAKFH